MPFIDTLRAISPIDGRYRYITDELGSFFSEEAFIIYRVKVEIEYLLALSDRPIIKLRQFTFGERQFLRSLAHPALKTAKIVKQIETRGKYGFKRTDHDVKAIEYYIQHRLKGTSLEEAIPWVHFGLTSEDANNIAYGMMLSNALNAAIIPKLDEIENCLASFARKYRSTPMLARTHGKPASPTTFGKELNVFCSRLKRQLNALEKFEILVKLNGATGNYNAHCAAYKNADWLDFSKKFIESLSARARIRLRANFVTTQIEPHDTYAELFDCLRRINTILIDLCRDMCRYISDGWLIQKAEAGTVGSSTMPHKINPKDFENGEGNLGVANALFSFFSSKLPISRLQRDLSDSTVERNFGVVLAHCLVGYRLIIRNLENVTFDEKRAREALDSHPEVIAEAVQTILRREGFSRPYEMMKRFTRESVRTLSDIREFIERLPVSDAVKKELKTITPGTYLGIAKKLAQKK